MTRFLIPLFLILLGGALFALYTNGAYQSIQTLSAQAGSYDEALEKSQELRAARDRLLSKRNTFSTDSLRRLEYLLPNNVDNIRLVIDINNIAARHFLTLKNVSLGGISDSPRERGALAVGSSGDPIGSVELGFAVTASYDGFISFLRDLERSLRLIDVEELSYKPAQGGLGDYSVTIRTYWLR